MSKLEKGLKEPERKGHFDMPRYALLYDEYFTLKERMSKGIVRDE